MKRNLQKFLLLAAAFLCAICGCAQDVEVEDVEIGGIYYNLDMATNTASVTSENMYHLHNGHVEIPSTFNYEGENYTVTSIGGGSFRSSELTSITIPESVMCIGDSAFFYCLYLTSITIPNSVTAIGNYVFYGCI